MITLIISGQKQSYLQIPWRRISWAIDTLRNQRVFKLTDSARKQVARAAGWLLLAIPFLVVAIFIGELGLQILGPRLFPHGQRCVEFDPEVHHRYKPGCIARSDFSASAVTYEFNSFGLRDRAPSAFPLPSGAIAMLGDSVVKGLWVEGSQTIPAALEKTLGRPVLNAGVRFSGPTTQSLHFLRDVEPHYPVRGVIWLLNGSDPTDERFFSSRAMGFDRFGPVRFLSLEGDPFLEQDGWLPWLHARSRLAALAVRLRTFRWLRASIRLYPATERMLCGGIWRLAEHLKERKIPLLVALTPHYPIGLQGNWVGEFADPRELATMATCARAAGAEVVDLSAEKLERGWFIEDLIHYTPLGSNWLAGKLAGPAAALFREAPAKTGDKRTSKAPGSKRGS